MSVRLRDFQIIGTWVWQGFQGQTTNAFIPHPPPGDIPGSHFCYGPEVLSQIEIPWTPYENGHKPSPCSVVTQPRASVFTEICLTCWTYTDFTLLDSYSCWHIKMPLTFHHCTALCWNWLIVWQLLSLIYCPMLTNVWTEPEHRCDIWCHTQIPALKKC